MAEGDASSGDSGIAETTVKQEDSVNSNPSPPVENPSQGATAEKDLQVGTEDPTESLDQNLSESSGSDDGNQEDGPKTEVVLDPNVISENPAKTMDDSDSAATEKAKGSISPPKTNGKTVTGALSGSLLIQQTNVCKVIKGEIHNVLNVMRTDARYVSPLRFMEELPTDEHHPLLTQLRDLHRTLSEWELNHHNEQPKAKLYLPPFCAAVQGRDISASVTGAALHSIHKFMLYGFLANEGAGPYTNIAKTLLNCTFEESVVDPEEEELNGSATSQNHDDEQEHPANDENPYRAGSTVGILMSFNGRSVP